MEEIQFLVSQRLEQAAQLQALIERQSADTDKSEILKLQMKQFRATVREDEKVRNDKENWILNILKSVKVLTPDKKKQYVDSSVRLMSRIKQGWSAPQMFTQDNLANNFTEDFINLYADFFDGMDSRFEFKLSVRQIIRPNNRTVVVDLVKYFVNFTRDYFKQITLQSQSNGQVPSETVVRVLPFIDNAMVIVGSVNPLKLHHSLQRKNSEECYDQSAPSLVVRPKRVMTTYELLQLEEPCGIYQKDRPQRISGQKNRQEIAITLFLKLKEHNSTINYKNELWRNQITGSQKSLPYNYHNLYTKQEIERLEAETVQLPQPIPAQLDIKENQMKSYIKAYISCEVKKQHKPKSLKNKNSNGRYREYIILRYDSRYPLELLQSQKILHERAESLGVELRGSNHVRSSAVLSISKDRPTHNLSLKKREIKGLFGAQSSQILCEEQSQATIKRTSNLASRANLSIVDRVKVLKIRKDALLPEVTMKTPNRVKMIDFRQMSQAIDLQDETTPYSNRSCKSNILSFASSISGEQSFRNVRTFAKSKCSEANGPLQIYKIIQQHRNIT